MVERRPILAMFVAFFIGVPAGIPATRAQTTWYADDDAPNDPGSGDPTVSDPSDDGSGERCD